jgi:hypothetical protein
MSVESWLAPIAAAASPVAVSSDELEELRQDLEHAAQLALASAGAHLRAEHLPLRLPKGRLADLERCERTAVARSRSDDAPALGAAALRGTALDHFVAHQLVAGRVREPVADLVSMLEAWGDWDSLAALDELGEQAGATLAPLAAAVAEEWAGIDPAWAPRTQVRATLSLADGACSCAGVVDVELGGPGTGRPAVLIEVKSGGVAVAHPHEAYLYGLLVALRDRCAPAVVARWYPGADPVGLPVTLGVLEAAAARLRAGMQRWAELVTGDVPDERAGAWCAWCPDRAVCPSAAESDAPTAGDRSTPDAELEDGDDGW